VGRHLESFHLHCETATISLTLSTQSSSSSQSLSSEHLSLLAQSYKSLLLSHPSGDGSNPDDLLVWKEIINSCTKKLIALLRSSSSNSVNSLLISYRKHLKSSIVLPSSSPTEPNQRYFQALYDLLGSWGMLIETIRDHFGDTRNEILYGWLLLFHRRVVEASFESYEEFKNNKKLNNWLMKHSEITMVAPGTPHLSSLPLTLS
jgi:hypothetical protein